MTDADSTWLAVQDAGAVGAVRRSATRLGQTLGLGEARLADIAIVASELGSNLYKHADDGHALIRAVRRGGQAGVEIVTMDKGPGMADLDQSIEDGHSTSGTLGIGLGAVARQASEFDAYSRPGTGTVIAAAVWEPPVPSRGSGFEARGLGRPMSGQEISGDGYASRITGRGTMQLMVCDGLGHGPLAARAAQTAEAAFRSAAEAPPKEVLEHLHRSLVHTRGAVAMVVELDADLQRARFAGLGNISGSIIDQGQRRMMVSQPGIAGHQRPSLRELELPCSPTAVVVLHSDGLHGQWSMDNYPGLASRTPLVVAATLFRDASVRRDDATLMVAKARE
jgi:anti-sigma regulatory factor (Ser/Thr protein kinase)